MDDVGALINDIRIDSKVGQSGTHALSVVHSATRSIVNHWRWRLSQHCTEVEMMLL